MTGIVIDAIESLVGTPTNFVGEIIFWWGAFLLTGLIMMGLGVLLIRVALRK